MEPEFKKCPHCGTEGILIMADGKCPHCKKSLAKIDKQLIDVENNPAGTEAFAYAEHQSHTGKVAESKTSEKDDSFSCEGVQSDVLASSSTCETPPEQQDAQPAHISAESAENQHSQASYKPPSEKDKKSYHQFSCLIANPGHISDGEWLDHYVGEIKKTGAMRDASISFQNETVTLKSVDTEGTKVTLLQVPMSQIEQATYHNVRRTTQARNVASHFTLYYGIPFGIAVCFYIYFSGEDSVLNRAFLLFSFMLIVFFAVSAYILAIIKGFLFSSNMMEYRFRDSKRDILRFRVTLSEHFSVAKILRDVGLTPESGSSV